MARSNYSRYEYETSPRKLEPYYAPKKKITEVKRETKQENKKKQCPKLMIRIQPLNFCKCF